MAKAAIAKQLPDPGKVSIKRSDMFRLGKLIEDASEDTPSGRAYKLGKSDASIAADALAHMQLPVTAEAVARMRKTMLGKFTCDKGGTKDRIEALNREVSALRKQAADQGKIIADLGERLLMVERDLDGEQLRPSISQQAPISRSNGSRR